VPRNSSLAQATGEAAGHLASRNEREAAATASKASMRSAILRALPDVLTFKKPATTTFGWFLEW